MDLRIRSIRSAGLRSGRTAATPPASLRPPTTPGSAVGRLSRAARDAVVPPRGRLGRQPDDLTLDLGPPGRLL